MFANNFGKEKNVCCGLVQLIRKGEEWEPPAKAPIPLISVNVTASVVHAVAQVEVTQVYVNKEEQPIEAIYYFPTNPDGAITHFQAELEGRIIKGTVKPQEEAKEAYEKAIENKTTAFLGEETKADIFKVRVGYLKPGTQVKVIIGYVAEVKNEPGSNSMRFYIPTTIAPRYVSPSETDEKAQDIKDMKFSATSPAPLSLKVAVSLQSAIKSIESPTHSIKVEQSGPIPEKQTWHKALVELSGDTNDMDRDFVLNIVPEEIHKPRLYSEKLEDGSTAVMVHLVPSFKLDEQKTELIFVLDRSGSMMGQSIDLAKKALSIFLHSMPADCYFNVVGFGSTYKFLFPKSVKYDDGSLKTAIDHAKKLGADLGGTEILEPLKEIYKQPGIEGYLRQIFILTDGEVSNTDGVLGIAQANAHQARVFALGIGDGASHYLVEGIAKAGGGTSAFVTYNESIDKKVLNQLKNGMQPSLTEIELEWEGVENIPVTIAVPVQNINKEKTLLGYNKPMETTVGSSDQSANNSCSINKQSPKRIPPVYDGSQLLVFGLFQSERPTSVLLKSQSPDGPLTIKVEHSSETDVGKTGMLHRLAAIKLVRELELEIAALHFQDLADVSAREEQLKKEIIELACKNGVTSKYTSFVAIDVNDDKKAPDNWVMETRNVPSQFAHGWHGGFGGGGLCGAPPPMMAMACSMPMSANLGYLGPMFGGGGAQPKMCKRVARCAPSNILRNKVSTGAKRFGFSASLDESEDVQMDVDEPAQNLSPMEELISLQSFDGSYNLDEKLSNVLGKPIDVFKDAAAKNGLDEKILATALAIAFFTSKMADEKDLWDLLVAKAKKWLVKMTTAEKVDGIIATAAALL